MYCPDTHSVFTAPPGAKVSDVQFGRRVDPCQTVGKIGEVDEMGERELVLVVSVRCGKERDMTR